MPQIIKKPWGGEEIWARTAKYVGKLLYINKDASLSKQYHVVKEETIRVLEGRIELTLTAEPDAIPAILLPSDTVHLKPGVVHKIKALEDTILLEVSTPELEDVVRLSDDYGRVKEV